MDVPAKKVSRGWASRKARTALLPKCRPPEDSSKGLSSGGAWQTSTSGFNAANLAKRCSISRSLYSPGVSNGVGLE